MADRTPIDAVVGVDDQGVLTAAHAGEILGLATTRPTRSPPPATRPRCAGACAVGSPSARLPRPGPRSGRRRAAARSAVRASSSRCRCRRAPASSADTPADARSGVAERIRRILADHGRSPDEALLIERFVPGAEVSLEALLHDGDLQVLALFDKPDPLDGPYFEGDDLRHAVAVGRAGADRGEPPRLRPVGRSACATGPVHAELRVGPGADGEVAGARGRGPLDRRASSRVLRFGTGISLEQLIVEHAVVGTSPTWRNDGAAGVMMLPIPRSGVTGVGV